VIHEFIFNSGEVDFGQMVVFDESLEDLFFYLNKIAPDLGWFDV